MSLRLFSRAAVAVALSAVPFQAALADEPAPAAQAAPVDGAPTAPAPGEQPRPRRDGEGREGGPREGGPRGEGGRRGEGGPRSEGGPRGGGPGGPGGGNFNARRPDETPEQYQARMLRPYLEMVPDLNADQQTHIMKILEAASLEQQAIRDNPTLSEERRRAASRYVRGDIVNRIASALNEEQYAAYKALREEQEAAAAEMNQVGSVRPDEDIEAMRARLLTGYEAFMEELSVKQKTQIIKILEAAGEESATVQENAALSVPQKTQALGKIHDGVNAKVLPLLDADQAAAWKKAHAAKRLELPKIAATPVPAPAQEDAGVGF